MSSSHVALERFLDGRDSRPLPGPHTYAHRVGEGIAVRLYETDIVTHYPDGRAVLRCDGHVTATTQRRISDYLPPGWSIRRTDGRFHVQGPRPEQHGTFADHETLTIISTGSESTMTITAQDVESGTITESTTERTAEQVRENPRAGDVLIDSSGDQWLHNGHAWGLRTVTQADAQDFHWDHGTVVLADAWEPYRLPTEEDRRRYGLPADQTAVERTVERVMEDPRVDYAVIDKDGDLWRFGHRERDGRAGWACRTRSTVDMSSHYSWSYEDQTLPAIYGPYRSATAQERERFGLAVTGGVPQEEVHPPIPTATVPHHQQGLITYFPTQPWWSIQPWAVGHNNAEYLVGITESHGSWSYAQTLRNQRSGLRGVPEEILDMRMFSVSHVWLSEAGITLPDPRTETLDPDVVRRALPGIDHRVQVYRSLHHGHEGEDGVLIVSRRPFSPLARYVTPFLVHEEKITASLLGWHVLRLDAPQWAVFETVRSGRSAPSPSEQAESLRRTLDELTERHEELRNSVYDHAVDAARSNGAHEFLEPVKQYLEDLGYDTDEIEDLKKRVRASFTLEFTLDGVLDGSEEADSVNYSSVRDSITVSEDGTRIVIELSHAGLSFETQEIEYTSWDVNDYDTEDYED